ncbi:hypothetical protein EWM64_g1509 [Hericium alpestre]|uniref:Uncharacterized protein n=1 Tax=Hericium alpestre TaxID=135208 RepID=A0A4Z0A640_9AGAM|nr:hypothetical protein EWM64_g1509 [Hericium alpestre]
MLVGKLLHNQEHYHTFFNDQGRHNHATHHLFALYGLGASADLIEAAYAIHMTYLTPVIHSPHAITDDNFVEHLGDDEYYNAYHAYFSNYLSNHTMTEAVENYIFAPEYNYIPGAKKQPEMLNRCLASLIHPFIHIGYGVEFEVKGQLAEGLAMTAVHPTDQTPLVPYSLFSSHQGFSAASTTSLLSHLGSVTLADGAKSSITPRPTFSLYQRILEEPAFEQVVPLTVIDKYEHIVENQGDLIHKLVTEWYDAWLEGVQTRQDAEARLEAMVEEVVWAHVMIYGVGGFAGPGIEPAREINADFFIMHIVTSALFLPSFLLPDSPTALTPPLSLTNRFLLLRTFVSVSIGWYISRGRPALPIVSFYAATEKHLSVPSPPQPLHRDPPRRKNPPPTNGTPLPKGPLPSGASPWLRIIQNALVHPVEHLVKLQRVLAFFAVKYGGREQGHFAGAALEGAEKLDGTLFLRAAGLTMDRLGRANEGVQLDIWDYEGFFDVDHPEDKE